MEALVDGDLKRSLFEHMYNKGGIQKAKYIRLMDTEFFAREQHFDDMETERNEMAEDEGLGDAPNAAPNAAQSFHST
ncbi:hypothetical protein BGX31_007649 [Mortierella sp. GBA43]|nr:hypothetical protein BGX31_007649 [Mortierella sp. GBA43]